jgi:hypothetical protein
MIDPFTGLPTVDKKLTDGDKEQLLKDKDWIAKLRSFLNIPSGGGSSIAPSSGVQSVVAGTNVTVDNTDPSNPIVSSTGGGGGVAIGDTIGNSPTAGGLLYSDGGVLKNDIVTIATGQFNIPLPIYSVGDYGDLSFYTPNAVGTDASAGDINFYSGSGDGTAHGGNWNATAGQGGDTGDGGFAGLSAGTGGATSGDGGHLYLTAGYASGSGDGGNAIITAGNAVGGTDGSINLVYNGSTGATPGNAWVLTDETTGAGEWGTPAQTYQTFIYNSSGGQAGNRYNDWSDLITAKTGQEGQILIIIEQDELIPAGAWNLDYCTLKGNGSEYNAGGFTLTWGDSTTISSWLGSPSYNSIRMLSTSTTGSIYTTSSPIVILTETVSNTHSTNYPFYKFTGSGQCIIAIRNSARWTKLAGGVENLEVTSGAFTCQLIISRGDGAVVANNTLKSTNAVIYLDIFGSSNLDATGYPSTHTNLVVGFELDLYLTDAAAVKNTPAGDISATTVQAAINELDSEKVAKDTSDVYTVSNDSTARSLDADTILLGDVADTLATLIKDLQDRGIIG